MDSQFNLPSITIISFYIYHRPSPLFRWFPLPPSSIF